MIKVLLSGEICGTLDRIRTCDLLNRNQMLYPAELRVHKLFMFIKSEIIAKLSLNIYKTSLPITF
jgi:hypothetical protein